LSLQLKYPDFFGGAWVYNPDPIDFRRYQLVNIYEDENAFFAPGRSWHEKNFADMLREMAEQVKKNAPPGESRAWAEY